MIRRTRGFTLAELVVVLGIILILALILTPVFVSAKRAAQQTVCASNMRQAWEAMKLYLQDEDSDLYPPANYEPGVPNPDPSSDRTWVQLLLPYAKSISIFHCPGDYGQRPRNETSSDPDFLPGDTYERYYDESLRSDMAYNYIYLAPIIKESSGSTWQVLPKSETGVNPQTILFLDSVFDRAPDGTPVGGGSFLAEPPCRYEVSDNGAKVDTFLPSSNVITGKGDQPQVFTLSQGWSADPNSKFLYGQAWPWHNGKMNVIRVDGSVRALTPQQLSAGCNVRPAWTGFIVNAQAYTWGGGQ